MHDQNWLWNKSIRLWTGPILCCWPLKQSELRPLGQELIRREPMVLRLAVPREGRLVLLGDTHGTLLAVFMFFLFPDDLLVDLIPGDHIGLCFYTYIHIYIHMYIYICIYIHIYQPCQTEDLRTRHRDFWLPEKIVDGLLKGIRKTCGFNKQGSARMKNLKQKIVSQSSLILYTSWNMLKPSEKSRETLW